MVTRQEIERQLKSIKADFTWWGRGEAKELERIIEPDENITYCINGRYESGFAMLCVTDQRVVLIDKKPLYLSLEDIRYDMISEVDFDGRLLDSSVTICSFSKKLRFTSWHGKKLRDATAYLQRRIMEFRQQPAAPSQLIAQAVLPSDSIDGVRSYQHSITNPYTKVPLAMRRRITRYYN